MKGALAGALSGSALLLGAAILGRLLGRPLVPDWVMVASFLGALAAFAALIFRMREAAADAAVDGSAVWSWSQAPSAGVAAGVILVSAAFMVAITAFLGLKQGGPAQGRPGCEFRLNNKGAETCVDEATYGRAGASEQSLFLSIAAAFIAFDALGFACTREASGSSPIWVEGTRDADWH